MAELVASIRSEWWKADAYEISDGCFAPAPGARVSSYDPMAAYWESIRQRIRAGSKPVEAPYAELIRLLDKCRWEPGPHGKVLARGSQQMLLGWVKRNGLLGVLPHTLLQVTGCYETQPGGEGGSPGPVEVLWARDVENPDRAPVELRMLGYGRIGSISASVQDLGTASVDGTYEQPGDILATASAGRVSVQEVGSEDIVVKAWDDVARPFFTHPVERLDGTSRYPFPAERDFGTVYREPIDQFLRAAHALYWAFYACAFATSVRDPDVKDEAGIHEWTGPAALNLLLSRVRPSLRPCELGWEGHWRSPSLLGILATQAYWDLSRGKNFGARLCGYCKKPFPTRTPRQEYCQDNCRKEAYRVRYLAKLEEKRLAGASE